MKEVLAPEFTQAVRDFAWMREKGYPRRLTYKLVCDHYKLNRFQRVIIYHSVYPRTESELRISRKVTAIEHQILWIDGFNLFFTLANYLLGRPVFLASDGVLRDAGEAYEKPDRPEIFQKAIDLLKVQFELLKPARIVFVLDQLVPFCQMLEFQLKESFMNEVVPVEVYCTEKADRHLINQIEGVVASSDSELIDFFTGPWIDLAAAIILPRMGHDPTDIRQILGDYQSADQIR